MEIEYEKAKKIFDMFSGNKFQMQREGVINEYQSYNIPVEIENDWKKEYLDKIEVELHSTKIISKKIELFTVYTEASNRFFNSNIISLVENFMKKNNLDSYTQIRLIELKFNALNDLSLNRKQIINDCINELLCLKKKELVVDNSYYIDGQLPDYLSNERLNVRIVNLITYWKNQV